MSSLLTKSQTRLVWTNRQADPTATTMIRAAYAADLRRSWQAIARLIKTTLVDNDALRLQQDAEPATKFEFDLRSDKQAAFGSWLDSIIDDELLARFDPARAPRPNPFIWQVVKKSIEKGDREVKRAGLQPKGLDLGPVDVPADLPDALANTLNVLYARNYEALKLITADTGNKIRQTLTEGVLAGIGTGDIAENIAAKVRSIGIVRSTILARTEVIHAFAEGSLDRYEQWGVSGVSAAVEFSTAGDARVCSQCEFLDKQVFTIDQARGVIPVHPQCRCAWLPLPPGTVPTAGPGAEYAVPVDTTPEKETHMLATFTPETVADPERMADLTAFIDTQDALMRTGVGSRQAETQAFLEETGNAGLPRVVSPDKLSAEVAGGATRVYRGLYGESNQAALGYLNDLRHGQYRVGGSIASQGNAIYVAHGENSLNHATHFIKEQVHGVLVEGALAADAKVISEDDLFGVIQQASNEMRARADTMLQQALGQNPDYDKIHAWEEYKRQSDRVAGWLRADLSRAANAFGYDAITALDGFGGPEFRVINRSKLILSNEELISK